jgi:lipid-binding SYLF domain-containing protein
MTTRARLMIFVSCAMLCAPASFVQAADDAAVVTLASHVLDQMANDPTNGVPLPLLKQSQGVVVVPNLINASFVVGVKIGRGVFMVRDSKGNWGNPIHVFISGGTVGLQAGGQATELVMVFRTKESVNRLLAGKGKITLGVDAGGPAGRNVGAETDLELKAEILTYAKSRGLFAGASLGGTGITVDRTKNSIYYDNFAATTFQIIEGESVGVPREAAKLKATLTSLAGGAGSSKPKVRIQDGDDEQPAEVSSRDNKVQRSSRTTIEAADDPATGRPSTRRRSAAANPDDEPEPAEPRSARSNIKRKPAPVDDPLPDEDPLPPSRSKSARRPAPPDIEDEPPVPSTKRKTRSNPDDPASF